MKNVVMLFVIASLIGTVGCKQTAESDPNMAKRSEDKNTAMNSCELNDGQLRLVSGASEFKSVETVDVKSLPEGEQAALKNRSAAAKCTATEVSTLSGVFPSIASRLSEAGN
ncbi:MAG: hypothetical protein EBR09_08865, partial [Proteobacteria bacterium]|nr:hypothetical protein [Pseudomonadota bacterium]